MILQLGNTAMGTGFHINLGLISMKFYLSRFTHIYKPTLQIKNWFSKDTITCLEKAMKASHFNHVVW